MEMTVSLLQHKWKQESFFVVVDYAKLLMDKMYDLMFFSQ